VAKHPPGVHHRSEKETFDFSLNGSSGSAAEGRTHDSNQDMLILITPLNAKIIEIRPLIPMILQKYGST